jgi:hypothetical protein
LPALNQISQGCAQIHAVLLRPRGYIVEVQQREVGRLPAVRQRTIEDSQIRWLVGHRLLAAIRGQDGAHQTRTRCRGPTFQVDDREAREVICLEMLDEGPSAGALRISSQTGYDQIDRLAAAKQLHDLIAPFEPVRGRASQLGTAGLE